MNYHCKSGLPVDETIKAKYFENRPNSKSYLGKKKSIDNISLNTNLGQTALESSSDDEEETDVTLALMLFLWLIRLVNCSQPYIALRSIFILFYDL